MIDSVYVDHGGGGTVLEISKMIKKILMDYNSDVDAGDRVLVHSDEHRAMTSGQSDAFDSAGAIRTLEATRGVTVVTTDTSYIECVNNPQAAGICRYPVSLPALDIHQVMKNKPSFQVDKYLSQPQSVEVQQLMSGVRFRLAYLMMNEFQLTSLHTKGEADNPYQVFRRRLADTVMQQVDSKTGLFGNDSAALLAITHFLCLYIKEPEQDAVIESIAADLLLGYSESDFPFRDRDDTQGLMLVRSQHSEHCPDVTLNLPRLLSLMPEDEGERALYKDCTKHFFDRALGSIDGVSSPLKTAYACVLPFYLQRLVRLRGCSFFQPSCCHLVGFRLFKGQDTTQFFMKPDQLRNDTLYYVRERTKVSQSRIHCATSFYVDIGTS